MNISILYGVQGTVSMQARIFTTASFKLTLLFAALFTVSSLALALAMFFSVRNSLHHELRTRIESETAQLLGDYDDDGLDELRHDVRERIEKNSATRLYYAVQRPDGREIFDHLPIIAHQGWAEVNHHGTPLLLFASALGNDYMLVVAADMTRIHEVVAIMRTRFLLALAAIILLGMAGGLWASKRFLARVDQLARMADRIGAGYLSERIRLSGNNDEFDHLAAAINRMLGRIEALVANVQHVSSSIAHDLRTPLGRLRQKLERLPQNDATQEAIGLLDSTLETFSALLRISEIESGSRKAGFTQVDLSALLQRLADTYQPLAEENGQHLHYAVAMNVHITGDEALLTQLFVNLLENALIHAGPGADICLGLSPDGAWVADNGPGIPEQAHATILKPFQRLDASRHHPGNGLGLTLANAIAELHDARLVLEDNRPGLRIGLRPTTT